MEDIMYLLDQLEDEITRARSAVFSKKVMVDGDMMMQIVTKLKDSIPMSIREARNIMENKDEIESRSQAEAKKIINEAEMRAEHIVSETELLRRAEKEAQNIRNEALLYNDTIKTRAKEYCDDMFKDLEKFLTETVMCVRNNREELKGTIISNPNKQA